MANHRVGLPLETQGATPSDRNGRTMEVTVAVLADAANIAKGEKLNILGTFDRIAVPAFPWTHPFMVLALAFRLTYEDARATHELAVTIMDEDGHDVAK